MLVATLLLLTDRELARMFGLWSFQQIKKFLATEHAMGKATMLSLAG